MSIADEITRISSAKGDLKAAIEANGGSVGEGTIDTYAPQVAAVYGAGYGAGEDAARKEFWTALQKNGTREYYGGAFRGDRTDFNDDNYRPVYDMYPTSAADMYHASPITDLLGIHEALGVVLDFSRCGDLSYTFYNSKITRVGVVDTRACSGLICTFLNATKLEYIEKVLLKDDGSSSFTMPFTNCPVGHCVFEGVIGKAFEFTNSNLDKESLASVISCLSADTEGLTVTLSKTAVNNAFETAPGAADGATGEEWLALTAAKANWQVVLA